MNIEKYKEKIIQYMNESQELRKKNLFDTLSCWKTKSIFREFKHFLSFKGEIVSEFKSIEKITCQ